MKTTKVKDETITLQETVQFLNSLLKLDREAVSKIFMYQVSCNNKLAAHKTVQVGLTKDELSDAVTFQRYHVRPLGILNGLFGVYKDGLRKGWGKIYMDVSEPEGCISHFGILNNPLTAIKKNTKIEGN